LSGAAGGAYNPPMAKDAEATSNTSDSTGPQAEAVNSKADLSALWTVATVVLIAGVALAAYSNTFDNPFLLDDVRDIVRNEAIRSLWPVWDVLTSPPRTRPLVNLSLAINYAISKLEVWSYHAWNLTVHVLAGLVLFGLVRRTLVRGPLAGRFARAACPLALVAAAVWVVHPLQTSAVSYTIQRAEMMMGLFYLLTLYAVVRAFDSRRSRFWAAAAVVACAAGMGCKQVMVSAPLVVLLYDRTFAAGSFREALRRRWGMYAGLVATWVLLVPSVLQITGGKAAGLATGISSWQYARTQFGVILHYLDLACWPDELCLDYTWRVARTIPEILLAALMIGALLLLTVWGLWRKRPAGFLGAAFFLILAPTSSVIPIVDMAFEHRMYLPLASVVVLVVVGGYAVGQSLLDRLGLSGRKRTWAGGVLGAVVAAGLVTALGVRTYHRNEVFDSKERMWADVIAKRPNNFRAYHNLGARYAEQGRPQEAIRMYKKAIAYWPDYADAYYHLAEVLRTQNRLDEALRYYREAAQRGQYLENPSELPRIQAWIAQILESRGEYHEAIPYYRKVLEAHPDNAVAHSRLALCYRQTGRRDLAIEEFRKALAISGEFAQAHYGLGVALAETGQMQEALEHLQEAKRLRDDLPGVDHRLGMVLARLGRVNESIDALQSAVRRQAENAAAQYTLGLLYAQTDSPDRAVRHLRRAVALQPKLLDAKNSLAWILATCRDAAVRDGEEAVELARSACAATGFEVPELLDTLAAAYAEAGQFEQAISTAEKAFTLAEGGGKTRFADEVRSRLALYRAGKPFHEGRTAATGPAED